MITCRSALQTDESRPASLKSTAPFHFTGRGKGESSDVILRITLPLWHAYRTTALANRGCREPQGSCCGAPQASLLLNIAIANHFRFQDRKPFKATLHQSQVLCAGASLNVPAPFCVAGMFITAPATSMALSGKSPLAATS